MIQIKKLIDITTNVMRECKLESLKNIKLSRKSNNIWNKIGLLYFGHQSFNNAF